MALRRRQKQAIALNRTDRGLQPQSRPFSARASDLERPAMNIEAVISVRRRLPDRNDSKPRLHSDAGILSLRHMGHELYLAIALKVLAPQDARKDISFFFLSFDIALLLASCAPSTETF